MKKLLAFCLSSLLVGTMWSQEVTWSEEIAEIIYDNCTTCHRPGEIGPFALTSYDEARVWANSIKFVTEIKYMPPWPPDRDYAHFQGERGLTDDEIQKIATWADQGAPRGNPDLEPEAPEFPSGSQIGTPDLVLSFDRGYMHKGTNTDDYRVFVLPTGLAEDKTVKSVELRPGNRNIVHHALISYDVSGTAQQLDNGTPEYGYQSFGGFGDGLDEAFNRQFPGYVPGQRPAFFPDGLGQILPAGSDLLLQIHYAPVAADEWDSTTVNIFFADEDEVVDRLVQDYIITPFTAVGDPGQQLLILPPNTVTRYHYALNNLPFDVSILAIWPHLHLLGRDWLVFGLNGTDTIPLVKIDDWDFNWQGAYNYNSFQVLPQGSSIHAYATYDNTDNNPLNPNNPPAWVFWGEKTTDEMFYLPISFVQYREGDEDIVFNDSLSSTYNPPPAQAFALRAPWPNPSRNEIQFMFELYRSADISMIVYDIEGNVVESLITKEKYTAGEHSFMHDLSNYSVGTYFVSLEGLEKPHYQLFQKL